MTSLPLARHLTIEPVVAAQPGDDALLRQLLDDGSDAAFRELYRRHVGRMFRVACRLMDSEADAEDVIQESWVRALQRAGSFEGRSSLGTWLTGIVINVAREQLGQRGWWQLLELPEDLPTPTILPLDGDIERAVALLPAGARAAFILHDVEGFTHEEIAERLGWVAGTSKTQLSRARRALRRALGERSENAS